MKRPLLFFSFLAATCWAMAYLTLFKADAGEQPGESDSVAANLGASKVTITITGGQRTISANGLPNHPTGPFPNSHNPNRISAQNYHFNIPAEPKAAEKATRLGMYPFGVAVNGVVFDPGAAEWWQRDPSSGWQYEPLSGAINLGVDTNNAHVQPGGAYHYHSVPTGLFELLTGGKPMVVLLGWAADGFPIYGPWGYRSAGNTNSGTIRLKSSYRIKEGIRPDGPGGKYDGSYVADYEYVSGLGDLDDSNGRFGPTPQFPQGSYYYVLTDNFPFIPRQFKGTPDPSFFRKGPPPGGPRSPGRRPGPPPWGPTSEPPLDRPPVPKI
jgi:hypothetical protein